MRVEESRVSEYQYAAPKSPQLWMGMFVILDYFLRFRKYLTTGYLHTKKNIHRNHISTIRARNGYS